jgi:hypothetical protein
MTTNIKTVLNHPTKGQDIRRLQLASLDKPYEQLLSFLTEIYALPPEKLTIRYRDDDGDDCSISSNIELLEAFRIAHQDGRSVLKVDISVDEDPIKDEATPGNPEPFLERSHSESSEEDFVKVEIGDTNTSNDIEATTSREDLEIKLISIPIDDSVEKPTEPKIATSDPTPTTESALVDQPAKTSDSAPVSEQPLAPIPSSDTKEAVAKESSPVSVAPESSPKVPVVKENSPEVPIALEPDRAEDPSVEKTSEISEEKLEEAKPFPSRAEFFSLLADFLHDAKVIELAQLLLPSVLKLLDEDIERPATEILQNIFDFAPIIKANPLTVRLLPFVSQLSADSKMKPLVKDALRKLHDASKLTAFFRSGPKGSIPYMPDFVRLYNHMNKLCLKRESDEKEEKEIPQPNYVASLQTLIHRGVECDGCQMCPIQGNRYKCYLCPDYDLCEICEEAGKHPVDHPMLKIRLPITNRQYQHRCARKSGLPRAQFVEDRTLRDGISCYPGVTVVKKVGT